MSGSTINDSSASVPLHGAGYPEDEKFPVAADAVAVKDSPKAKTKRPRPTFDDGSITRTFKFPSKSYPRSTFYVTGTEIIIRIKKARKKWKLVIPKKRSTSYRTNRWFTKPRWIEIDLTYTQAVKLGLIAPRPPSQPTTEAMPAIPPAASEPIVEGGDAVALDAADAESSVENETTDDETVLELDSDVGEPDQFDDEATEWAETPDTIRDAAEIADNIDRTILRINQGDAESLPIEATSDHEAPREDACEADLPESLPNIAAPTIEAEFLQPVSERSIVLPATPELGDAPPPTRQPATPSAADHLGPELTAATTARSAVRNKPARKVTATLLMFSLLGLAATATTWIAGRDYSEMWTVDGAPCARSQSPTGCAETVMTDTIVTGSIRRDEGYHTPEPSQQPAPETLALSAPAEAQQPEASAQDGAETESKPAGSTDELPKAVALATQENVPAPQDDAAIEQPLASAVPARTQGVVENKPACIALGTAAQASKIQFDFASSRLDHATLASLEHLAAKLQACPSTLMFIQGHTDADGDTERNQALSVRRAQAVWAHFVNAGVRADQLLVMGFGGSRPDLPNTSAENKQKNRRVVLVAELAR